MKRPVAWAALLAAAAVIIGVIILAWSDDAESHEWYGNLRSPITGASCCNDTDCSPVPSRITAKGGTEVFIRGKWWDAFGPWYLPQIVAPPDATGREEWHGCMMPSDATPRCTMGPATGA